MINIVIFVYSATKVLRYVQKCNDFNDLSTKVKKVLNFFDKLRSHAAGTQFL
jgi:hypothetical protein